MRAKAFYCAGTHWDREWYEPFQEYRMWLVELIDELMALMERAPEYRCFHLDGQAVVLEDYLAIRPERAGRLVKLMKESRVVAGPWYVLPDEWLVSGESFIRNLMTGMRVCRELGVEPMPFGYTPDQFGHIAALPMIMTGFGFQTGICWRGTQNETHAAHFVWIGPDGSRMLTCKLSDEGSYAPFKFAVRDRVKRDGMTDESYAEHFNPYFDRELARGAAPLVLMLDAIDHESADPEMPRILDDLQRLYPDIEFVWGALPEFAEELHRRAESFPEYEGELRQPARASGRGGQYLIVHTLSSRYPIKQRNDTCQALLEKWAEPYALFHQMAGGTPIVKYLDEAWRHLLKNHPHDSICGCSIDQVHRDMRFRFDQCEQIADGLIRRAMAHLAKAAAANEATSNIVVHNPLPWARRGVFEIAVPFNTDWPKRFVDGLSTGERINKFVLVKQDGGRVPFQLHAIERNVLYKRLRENGRKSNGRGDVYHLAVEMDLPPCGYTGFRVEPIDEATRNFGSLMTAPLAASNDLLSFSLSPDGLGRLVDEETGRSWENLFLYDDCGDCGDGWTLGRVTDDTVYRGPGASVSTAIDEDGPLRTVFRVERHFDVPAQLDPSTGARSRERVGLEITDRIYLEKGAPFLRVRTRIKNACSDHRLRVLLPLGAPAEASFAETPFAIVERPVAIPEETAAWHERINPETAFSTFVGLRDGSGGFAVLAPFGLHEYEVLQTPERTLALTLFRATGQTVGTPGEADGQLHDTMEFEYLLYPFRGGFDAVEASRLVAGAQVGTRSHATETLPQDRSFLKLHAGAAVVTAIKPAADEGGGIVRLWNPTAIDVCDVLKVNCSVLSAKRCTLDEQPLEALDLNGDGSISIIVPAGGLATVRFTWATGQE